jgi:alpha,alpha-trehalase
MPCSTKKIMLDYAIIGNCNTCALVRKDASIDWMCFPDFSSPSVFARILDNDKGGYFKVEPSAEFTSEQRYITDTNVLETVFKGKGFSFRVLDLFPRWKKSFSSHNKIIRGNYLVRIIEPISGFSSIRVELKPRLNYAMDDSVVEKEACCFLIKGKQQSVRLVTNAAMEEFSETFELNLKKPVFFALGDIENPEAMNLRKVKQLFSATVKYWQQWVKTLIYPEQNREAIVRSALTLKALTYSKTGAIIAAATTSIPEEAGGERCWDYRYCWIRDAAYTIDALTKIGRWREARRFMDFVLDQVMKNDHIQIMYGINGETRLKETLLSHLSGFAGSKPVRIGNAAYNQIQHDIYGEMIDVLYLYFIYYKFESRMSRKYWRFLEWLVNQIRFNWDKKDSGIWEFRGKMEHFTYSKFMCYIGMDRAIKIAQHFERDDLSHAWLPVKDEIFSELMKNGYDENKASFSMFFGSDELDASLLHMTYHEFLDKNDPRLINTVKRIYQELRTGALVRRYAIQDDFGSSTSSFTICTFWLIDALAYIGEMDKAKELYGKIMEYKNHLGLFSEDIDMKTGRLIGNFPQAYTHIAVINTSILLSEWSAKRKKIDWSLVNRNSWF